MTYEDLPMKKTFYLLITALLFACLSIFTAASWADEAAASDDTLRISVLAIGKADCIVIQHGGRTMMIDTGNESDSPYIISRLDEMKVSRIDYLLITHFDKDHVGGAADIISNLQVGTIFQPDEITKSAVYDNFNEAMLKRGAEPVVLRRDMTLELGRMEIGLYPPERTNGMVPNDYSIISSIRFGDKNFLFTGDATDKRLDSFLTGGRVQYDFIKVPHHGMIQTTSKPFMKLLRQSRPECAVITDSVRDDLRAGVIMLLDIYGVKTFMTDRGDVLIDSDGNKITVAN